MACVYELRSVGIVVFLVGSPVVQQPVHADQVNHAFASLCRRSRNHASNANDASRSSNLRVNC
jgi:hypothetical protein